MVRVTGVSLNAYAGHGHGLGRSGKGGGGGSNDYLEGDALVVGPRGEILGAHHQVSATPASWAARGTTGNPSGSARSSSPSTTRPGFAGRSDRRLQPTPAAGASSGTSGSSLTRSRRQGGADVAHIRQRGQLRRRSAWKAGEVRRHAFQDEIDVAGEGPALAHGRPVPDPRLERREFVLALRRELHHGEADDLVAEGLRVEQGAVAPDDAGLLQRPHAPQAGRRRQPDAARELDIGDAAVRLQLFQDGPVDGIEASAQRDLRNMSSGE